MRYQPLPIVGGSYADETRPWSQQDTVNWLPCAAEVSGARSDSMLETPPGLKPFLEITGQSQVRGTHNAEGKLFAVIGKTMYQINNAGVAIPLGTVPGIGRVGMSHNQISLGNEVIAVNGGAGYVYNTVTGDFQRITDPGYPGSATVSFIDGYLIGVEPHGRYAFNSNVANALDYNTLDRFTSEVSPDALVTQAVFNNKLLLLSTGTGEYFESTANSQQPFRTTRITFDKGCAGPYCVAEADNTVFFLGSDGMFYMIDGYRPVRISRRPLEQAIRGLNWSQAFAEVWEDAGFTVVYWTFPDGRTWGFNTADKEWHRRESYGINRWRMNTLTRWNDTWYAGDYNSGKLFSLDWAYALEDGDEFVSERTMVVIHDNQNRVLIPRIEFVMDTGQPETIPVSFPIQPSPPSIEGDAPDWPADVLYTPYQYTLSAGTPPYNVTLHTPPLPPGLSISAGGLITGTPTTVGTFPFVVRNTDDNSLYDDLPDSITVSGSWFAVSPSLSDGLYAKSSTGTYWMDPLIPSFPGGTPAYNRCLSGKGKILMLGSLSGRTSANKGVSWTSQTGIVAAGANCAVVAPAAFLVGANNTFVKRSTDGIAFVDVFVAFPPGYTGDDIRGICTNASKVVAVGYWSHVSTNSGSSWAVDPAFVSGNASYSALCVACTDTQYLAGCENNLLRKSSTGVGAWTSVTSPFAGTNSITAASYIKGRWVIGNSVGALASSADLITWTVSGFNLGAQVECIDSNGSLSVAVGGSKIATTPDGLAWTDRANQFAGATVTWVTSDKG